MFLRVVSAPRSLTPTGTRAAGPGILEEFYEYAQKDAQDYVYFLVAEAVDLIVIGTRGLDKPRRLFLGSVSGGVVADSNIQVLVVK